jgi:hypothetical protein
MGNSWEEAQKSVGVLAAPDEHSAYSTVLGKGVGSGPQGPTLGKREVDGLQGAFGSPQPSFLFRALSLCYLPNKQHTFIRRMLQASHCFQSCREGRCSEKGTEDLAVMTLFCMCFHMSRSVWRPDVVTQTFNPSTLGTEERRSVSLRPAWFT